MPAPSHPSLPSLPLSSPAIQPPPDLIRCDVTEAPSESHTARYPSDSAIPSRITEDDESDRRRSLELDRAHAAASDEHQRLRRRVEELEAQKAQLVREVAGVEGNVGRVQAVKEALLKQRQRRVDTEEDAKRGLQLWMEDSARKIREEEAKLSAELHEGRRGAGDCVSVSSLNLVFSLGVSGVVQSGDGRARGADEGEGAPPHLGDGDSTVSRLTRSVLSMSAASLPSPHLSTTSSSLSFSACRERREQRRRGEPETSPITRTTTTPHSASARYRLLIAVSSLLSYQRTLWSGRSPPSTRRCRRCGPCGRSTRRRRGTSTRASTAAKRPRTGSTWSPTPHPLTTHPPPSSL